MAVFMPKRMASLWIALTFWDINRLTKLTESGETLKDKALDIPAQMGSCLALTEEESKTMCRSS